MDYDELKQAFGVGDFVKFASALSECPGKRVTFFAAKENSGDGWARVTEYYKRDSNGEFTRHLNCVCGYPNLGAVLAWVRCVVRGFESDAGYEEYYELDE